MLNSGEILRELGEILGKYCILDGIPVVSTGLSRLEGDCATPLIK